MGNKLKKRGDGLNKPRGFRYRKEAYGLVKKSGTDLGGGKATVGVETSREGRRRDGGNTSDEKGGKGARGGEKNLLGRGGVPENKMAASQPHGGRFPKRRGAPRSLLSSREKHNGGEKRSHHYRELRLKEVTLVNKREGRVNRCKKNQERVREGNEEMTPSAY